MISVIVPVHNGAATVVRCVKSLREATAGRLEIIVVDDGSTDDSALRCESFADVVVGTGGRRGAAAARNLGRTHAMGDLLVFVDADVEAPPGALDELLAGLGRAAAAFGCYGALPPPGADNGPTRYKNHLHHFTHRHAARRVSTFWSGFGVVRADAFDAVGGFPETAIGFADVEDIRLGYALAAAGYETVVVATAVVDHHKQFTFASLISTDLVHRAIPWVDAMLTSHTFRPELAIAPNAIVGSVAAWTSVLAAAVGRGRLGTRTVLRVVTVGGATWLLANRALLRSMYRSFGSAPDTAAAAGLHALHSLYAPLGAAVGVGVHVARRMQWRR